MNVDEATFYDPAIFSILPMGFCYPGKGISGDLPPRPECAPLWHPEIFKDFKDETAYIIDRSICSTVLFKKRFKGSLTETVKNYKRFLPEYFPLPHPSPRNQNWVKVNPWFIKEAIPELQKKNNVSSSY